MGGVCGEPLVRPAQRPRPVAARPATGIDGDSSTAPSSRVPTRRNCSAASATWAGRDRPASTTRIAASATRARLCASAPAAVDGASTTMYRACRRRACTALRAPSDCNSPAALAVPPGVMTRSRGSRAARCSAAGSATRPDSTSLSPGMSATSKSWDSGGVPGSGAFAPTSTTSVSARAKAPARLAATTVDAAPGVAPVTSSTRSPVPREAMISLRRRLKVRGSRLLGHHVREYGDPAPRMSAPSRTRLVNRRRPSAGQQAEQRAGARPDRPRTATAGARRRRWAASGRR